MQKNGYNVTNPISNIIGVNSLRLGGLRLSYNSNFSNVIFTQIKFNFLILIINLISSFEKSIWLKKLKVLVNAPEYINFFFSFNFSTCG